MNLKDLKKYVLPFVLMAIILVGVLLYTRALGTEELV